MRCEGDAGYLWKSGRQRKVIVNRGHLKGLAGGREAGGVTLMMGDLSAEK